MRDLDDADILNADQNEQAPLPTASSQMSSPLEVAFNGELNNFYNNQLPAVTQNEAEGLQDEQKPGFGLVTEFAKEIERRSEVGELTSMSARHDVLPNPWGTPYDANWDPTSNKSNLVGIKPQYQNYILNAANEREQVARHYEAIKMQQEDEQIDNGSWLGKVLAFPLRETFFSPTNFVPIVSSLRYAKYSKTFLQNTLHSLPGAGVTSLAYNLSEQANADSDNLQDSLINTFVDTIGLSVFGGALGTLGNVGYLNKLYESRKLLGPLVKGVEYAPVMEKDGRITGLKAFDPTGSVGAAQVSLAQMHADSAMSANGVFSVPYVGKGLSKFLSLINPGVEGLTSPFYSVQAVADRVFSHGIITKGIEAGKAAPTKFDDIMAQIRSQNLLFKKQFDGAHAAINGVDMNSSLAKRTLDNAKYVRDQFQKPDGFVSKDEMSRRVRNVLINEQPDENNIINDLAKTYRDETDKLWAQYKKTYGLPDNFMSSKTARGYFMRVYNIPYLETAAGRQAWMQVIPEELKKQDQVILAEQRPIEEAKQNYESEKQRHEQLIQQDDISEQQIKESQKQLNRAKIKVTNLENELQNKLRDDESLRINLHPESHKHVSANEAEQIKEIRKPLDQAQKELKSHERTLDQHKKTVSELKRQQEKSMVAKRKAKTTQTIRKHQNILEELEPKLNEAEKTLNELESKRMDLTAKVQEEEQKIEDDLYSGNIDQNLYYHVIQENAAPLRVLKDPNERLRFRDVYESDYARQQDAKATLDTILNQTAEQTVNEIMQSMHGSVLPNMTSRRSFMVMDSVLHDNNFLTSNIASSFNTYRNSLMRKIAMKTVFPDVTFHNDPKELMVGTHKEFEDRMQSLVDEVKSIKDKQRDLDQKFEEGKINQKVFFEQKSKLEEQLKKNQKESTKLNKQFDRAKEYLRAVYERMMGRNALNKNPSATRTKIVRGLMAFSQGSFLGWVPFTQLQDFMGQVFKHGLFPFIQHGLAPFFAQATRLASTEEREAFREHAGQLGLGLQHLIESYSDKNMANDTQDYIPSQKWFSADSIVHGAEKWAHTVSNLAGTNAFDNANQRIAAFIFQSQIVKDMVKYQQGKLSQKKVQKWLLYGLDPKEWADRIVNGWKEAGGHGTRFNGYTSYYYKWSDTEASNKMASTIFKGVRDTVLTRKGLLDAPFWMDNLTASFIFQFKSYMFSSVTRYLVPLLQQGDRDQIMGTLLMVAAGTAQYQLRNLAAGRPVDEDPAVMAYHGIEEAGPFAFPSQMVELANILAEGQILKSVQNPRYANITKMGLTTGPVGGIAQMMIRLTQNMATGQTNKADLKRQSKMTGLLDVWYLKMLSDRLIDQTNLPKDRRQARAFAGAR